MHSWASCLLSLSISNKAIILNVSQSCSRVVSIYLCELLDTIPARLLFTDIIVKDDNNPDSILCG